MQFHAEFFPKIFSQKIKHTDRLMLLGSCFTDHIGQKLSQHKWRVMQNPNGIVFNPVSICKALQSYLQFKPATEMDLFEHSGMWGSWEHHTRFSAIAPEEALNRINSEREAASAFLKGADWLILTLGSAFVYERKDAAATNYGNVVANCHKIPADKFFKRLLTVEEVVNMFAKVLGQLKQRYPDIFIIFTVSPVRHLREGFVENNRSKAVLINAVHELVNDNEIFYFPAYELVIDDLRDYRFFAEDLVHPNYAATQYVWEKFTTTCVEEDAREMMNELTPILSAANHKPFNPHSEQHKNFIETYLRKAQLLMEKYPYINLASEIQKLSATDGEK